MSAPFDPQASRCTAPVPAEARSVALGLFSRGGGGHVSALDSIVASLEGCIEVRRMAPLGEVFGALDPLARLTRGAYTGESLFNTLAAGGWTRLLGLMGRIGAHRMRAQHVQMVELFGRALAKAPPRLVISAMPFVNGAVSEACGRLRIPFIVVPTDVDLTTFLLGLPDVLPPRQRITHAFDGQAAPKGSICTGYPLRGQFTRPVCVAEYTRLRARDEISADTQVITITIGSAGGVAALRAAKALARAGAGRKYHLVICCGRNARLFRRAQALRLQGVSWEVRGYVHDFRALLARSDLVIAKPGGGTVMEILALGVRLVLDGQAPCAPWERANVDYAVAHGAAVWGGSQCLADVVDALLAKPRTFGAAAHFPHFSARLAALVTSL